MGPWSQSVPLPHWFAVDGRWATSHPRQMSKYGQGCVAQISADRRGVVASPICTNLAPAACAPAADGWARNRAPRATSVSGAPGSACRAQPALHERRANHFARQVDSVHPRLPHGDAAWRSDPDGCCAGLSTLDAAPCWRVKQRTAPPTVCANGSTRTCPPPRARLRYCVLGIIHREVGLQKVGHTGHRWFHATEESATPTLSRV